MTVRRLAAGIALIVTALFLPAPAQSAETVTLKLANWSSATGAGGLLFQKYAEEVEKNSGGRLKLEVFHGATLGPVPKHFDLVKSGVADMGYFVTYLTPGRFPLSDVFQLPNIFGPGRTDSQATRILMQLAPDYLVKEFDGVRIVWLSVSTMDQVFTANAPIRTLEDIKGKRLRVVSKAAQVVLKDVGAVPMSVPPGDAADALQKNALDGVHSSLGGIWTLKLGELIKYRTPLLRNKVVAGLAINQVAYDKLPDDLKAVIDGLGGTEGAVRFARALEEDNPLVAAYVKDHEFKASEADPALLQAVDKASEAFSQERLAEYDAKGLPARELFARIRELDGALK